MALDYKSSLGRYRRYLQLVQTKPLWSASMWVIMSLILLIILTWLALRPTLITISGLFGQIRQQKELSERLDRKILAVGKAITEMEAVENDLILLEKMVPDNSKWEKLTEDIYREATNSGIIINSISVTEIPKTLEENPKNKQTQHLVPQGLFPVSFTVSARGDYNMFIKTLAELEKNERALLFSSVTTGINKDGGLDFYFSGEVGFLPREDKL